MSATLKIGVAPSKPGKPVFTRASFSDGTINISWGKCESEGGWPITEYQIWVDDGAGVWPVQPISVVASTLTTLSYQLTGLAGGMTYGIKITAKNAI